MEEENWEKFQKLIPMVRNERKENCWNTIMISAYDIAYIFFQNVFHTA